MIIGGVKEVNGRLVLNYSDSWIGSVRHPEHIVRELLTKLTQLMKGNVLVSAIFCNIMGKLSLAMSHGLCTIHIKFDIEIIWLQIF